MLHLHYNIFFNLLNFCSNIINLPYTIEDNAKLRKIQTIKEPSLDNLNEFEKKVYIDLKEKAKIEVINIFNELKIPTNNLTIMFTSEPGDLGSMIYTSNDKFFLLLNNNVLTNKNILRAVTYHEAGHLFHRRYEINKVSVFTSAYIATCAALVNLLISNKNSGIRNLSMMPIIGAFSFFVPFLINLKINRRIEQLADTYALQHYDSAIGLHLLSSDFLACEEVGFNLLNLKTLYIATNKNDTWLKKSLLYPLVNLLNTHKISHYRGADIINTIQNNLRNYLNGDRKNMTPKDYHLLKEYLKFIEIKNKNPKQQVVKLNLPNENYLQSIKNAINPTPYFNLFKNLRNGISLSETETFKEIIEESRNDINYKLV